MSYLTKQLTVTVAGLRGPDGETSPFGTPFTGWAQLYALRNAMATGTRATVLSTDTGTHDDPLAGAGTLNAGIFEKQEGYETPVRVGALDSQSAKVYADQALSLIVMTRPPSPQTPARRAL